MMELAYLLRGHVRVLAIKVEHIPHSGVPPPKGSEGELTMLSDRLRAALSDVRAEITSAISTARAPQKRLEALQPAKKGVLSRSRSTI